MPAVSEKQRRFMGAELGRKRAGKKTVTKMTESQLRDYAKKDKKAKKNPGKRYGRIEGLSNALESRGF